MSAFPTVMVLATDGSGEAASAAGMAVGLARATGSELRVVHVLELPLHAYNPSSFEPDVRERLEGDARARLEEATGEVEEAGAEVGGSGYAGEARPERAVR